MSSQVQWAYAHRCKFLFPCSSIPGRDTTSSGGVPCLTSGRIASRKLKAFPPWEMRMETPLTFFINCCSGFDSETHYTESSSMWWTILRVRFFWGLSFPIATSSLSGASEEMFNSRGTTHFLETRFPRESLATRQSACEGGAQWH